MYISAILNLPEIIVIKLYHSRIQCWWLWWWCWWW